MATIKSYTSIEQSKKLAEILPIESADWTILNCFNEFGQKDGSNIRVVKEVNTLNESVEKIPCWSLAALISALPNDTSLLYFDDSYQMVYDKKPYVISNKFDNPVDACVAIIEKLHELNLL